MTDWLLREREAEKFLKKWLSGIGLLLVIGITWIILARPTVLLDRLAKWESQLQRYWND